MAVGVARSLNQEAESADCVERRKSVMDWREEDDEGSVVYISLSEVDSAAAQCTAHCECTQGGKGAELVGSS